MAGTRPSGAGLPNVQRFKSDSLSSVELGLRLGRRNNSPVTLDAAVSYATWADIQADLIDAQGLPFTTNIGSGRIYGFEAQATWQITPWLRSDVATFINDSALSQPAPAFIAADERDLPNIAKSGARAALHVGTALSPAATLSFDGSVRYVGHSKLGIGAPLEIDQGGYLEGDLGASVEFAKWGISLNATNVGDVRANRFSFGNPFTVAAGRQITPLRPRSIRIGLDARF